MELELPYQALSFFVPLRGGPGWEQQCLRGVPLVVARRWAQAYALRPVSALSQVPRVRDSAIAFQVWTTERTYADIGHDYGVTGARVGSVVAKVQRWLLFDGPAIREQQLWESKRG